MIFISHKKEDKDKAVLISKYLEQKGVDSYIDVLDPNISYKNVTERIVEQLRKATHLIVVFSEYTKDSMWVPFELGIAYERNNGIGIYLWPDTDYLPIKFPEYLDEFPIMETKNDLDKYIELYQNQKPSIIMERRGFMDSTSIKNYAQRFIDELKHRLEK